MNPRRPLRRTALAGALAVVALSSPDLGARPGGGQSFRGSSTSSSPSRGSTSSGSGSGSTSRGSTSSGTTSSGSGSTSRGSTSSGTTSSGTTSSGTGTYSGGTYVGTGTSSGSGTYGGDSEPSHGSFFGAFFKLFILAIILTIIIVWVIRSREQTHQQEWDAGLAEVQAGREARYGSLIAALDAVRRLDPEFSFVLFEDFLYALYSGAHMARGAGKLPTLVGYLSEPSRSQLGALGAGPVSTVIVGSLQIEEVVVGTGNDPLRVTALFESNYTEGNQAYYAAERWVLTRPTNVRSRPPARATTIDCPNCGAPLDKLIGHKCSYCNQVIDSGAFDWMVQSIEILKREATPPILTEAAEEVGTDDPTIVAPDARERYQQLVQRDPATDWTRLQGRVDHIFRAFHEAWGKREPQIIRPYLSDNLFQTQLYWIDAYRTQHLRNRTDNSRIINIQMARVVSDARYDAITVRVFATGLDYTETEAGDLVTGSKTSERNYTEYWTLIRGAGRTGEPKAEACCPSCGAGLDINMAGICKFCNAKITSGEFDWVLSRIEQDEVYQG
jgi:hypothetical protein